jgi:hypothetical protein
MLILYADIDKGNQLVEAGLWCGVVLTFASVFDELVAIMTTKAVCVKWLRIA